MANINLKKYGFILTPEENFSDDGNYFYAYRFQDDDRVRLTKCTAFDEIFISIEYRSRDTGFYKFFDDLNGVSRSYAIDHIEEVVNNLKEFLKNIDTIDTVQVVDKSVFEEISSKSFPRSISIENIMAMYNINSMYLLNETKKELYKLIESRYIDTEEMIVRGKADFFKDALKFIGYQIANNETAKAMLEKFAGGYGVPYTFNKLNDSSKSSIINEFKTVFGMN